MDGDLLGDMALAAPANESASQTQPTTLTHGMDLLGGSPINTKEQAPTGSPINNLQNGQDGDAGGDRASQLPYPVEFQTQAQSEPQEQQQTSANGLLDFPASSAASGPSDLLTGATPFSDDPHSRSDPVAPPSQQQQEDPPFDPFSNQPAASPPDPFAPPTSNDTAVDDLFAAFSDRPQQLAAPDPFGVPFPPEATRLPVNSHSDPFAPVEQTDAVEKSGNGNQLVDIQSVERTETDQTPKDDKDESSQLENTTVVPRSAQLSLETPSDKPFPEKATMEPPSDSTPVTTQQKPETPPAGKEVPIREEVGPTIPDENSRFAPDPTTVATTETSKNESDSCNDSKDGMVGQSQSNPTEPSVPQNVSHDKSENSKSGSDTDIPARRQSQGKAQPKLNATTNGAQEETGQQVPNSKEPAKTIPPIIMGMGSQKLDFGKASNMFRSFSSKSGAQLKQLQSKGGVSLKVGLSKLGEASSNLAGTIKQKNAVTNVFKAEDPPRSANVQPDGNKEPSRNDVGKKQVDSKENASETSSTAASVTDNGAVAISLEEKNDDCNSMENDQDGDTEALKVPHSKDTSTTSANATAPAEKTTAPNADRGAEPTREILQTKGNGKSESKEKDLKKGITASAVTSLFGLKIEKLPTAEKTKVNGQDKKKSQPKSAEQSKPDIEKTPPPTIQPGKQNGKEENRLATDMKFQNEAAMDDDPETAIVTFGENPAGSQKKQDIVQTNVEAKVAVPNEPFEEKKQEPCDNPSSSDGDGDSAEVKSAQSASLPEQNARLSARIAALEKELWTDKEGSSKEIQTLKKELQASKEDSAQQIQTLQEELQASKDGSSRLIKSLEKKLHSSQETVKQLKDKSMKLQQGAEENELKKDLIEDLNNKLQTEMSKRQESETTAKKTKEKLDKVVEQFNGLQKTSKDRLLQMKGAIDKLVQSNKKMEEEIVGIREERDEQGRRLGSNTTQLNEAKKNAAIKVNAAEHYELKMNELDAELKQTKDKMAQIKFERDRFRKELGNWKKYAEDRNKQLEAQLKHEKKLNEERKLRMKFFVEAKTEEARSSNVENVSLQAELDQTTRSLKDFNQRYKQLQNQWVQAQTRNRELQRDMAKMKNDSEKMSKVGGSLEAKLSRYSKEIEDHKSKRLAAKNELMTVIAKLEEEKKATTRLRDFVKGTIIPKVLLQHQVLQESADHFEGGIRQLALRFGREFSSLRRKTNSKPDPLADWKPKTLEDIQSMVGDANTARILSKLEDETQRVNEQVSNVSTSVEQLESLLVAPTTKGCVGAMFGTF